MPAILTFPLYGPSRRADVSAVEVRLDSRDPEFPRQYPDPGEINRRLAAHGLAPLPPGAVQAQQPVEHELDFACVRSTADVKAAEPWSRASRTTVSG